MLDMRRIGANISELRKKKDMTQLELADMLNISHQAVSKWERGESMPDIMLLPKLSEIFNTSIDQLLSGGEAAVEFQAKQAKVITAVINHKTDNVIEMINGGEVDMQVVAEVAPVLKPSTISQIVRGSTTITVEHICTLAPFLDQSDLERVIGQVELGNIDGQILTELAPFVKTGTLDKLVDKVMQGSLEVELLVSIAPFLSRERLDQLVSEVSDDKMHVELLEDLAPFLSREALDKLVDRVIVGEVKADTIVELAPFLSQDSLQRLVNSAAEGQINGELLSELAPFLSKTTISEIINKMLSKVER